MPDDVSRVVQSALQVLNLRSLLEVKSSAVL